MLIRNIRCFEDLFELPQKNEKQPFPSSLTSSFFFNGCKHQNNKQKFIYLLFSINFLQTLQVVLVLERSKVSPHSKFVQWLAQYQSVEPQKGKPMN
jgi:hypothetical protein